MIQCVKAWILHCEGGESEGPKWVTYSNSWLWCTKPTCRGPLLLISHCTTFPGGRQSHWPLSLSCTHSASSYSGAVDWKNSLLSAALAKFVEKSSIVILYRAHINRHFFFTVYLLSIFCLFYLISLFWTWFWTNLRCGLKSGFVFSFFLMLLPMQQ